MGNAASDENVGTGDRFGQCGWERGVRLSRGLDRRFDRHAALELLVGGGFQERPLSCIERAGGAFDDCHFFQLTGIGGTQIFEFASGREDILF